MKFYIATVEDHFEVHVEINGHVFTYTETFDTFNEAEDAKNVIVKTMEG